MDDDKASRRATSQGKPGKSKAISGVAAFSAFVGSISFGLVIGLVPGAFQVAGVTSMAMAHVMLLIACLMAVISLWHMESFKERAKGRVALVVGVIAFFGWLDFWMVKERAKLASSADVGIRLVYPHGPALQVVNLSNVVAREMKYVVVLWNLNLPERIDPLPIPAATFDWLKPHLRSSPRNLFSTPTVEPLLHPGDRLVGSMSVNCPDCIRGHLYVVSIVWKRGGWFAEVPDAKEGSYFFLTSPTKERIAAFAEELSSSIPEHSRIPIEVPVE